MVIKIIVVVIRFYQKISFFSPRVCRFYPTCSEYTVQSLQKYGIVKGTFLAMKRLLKCHPFHLGGYDPVK